ncbi:psbP domain-containing protein 4, chloroplastic-like isoform X1 [Coffea arabica]|uniref:PsbP domain-containing protein 4, chloroplastic-like isoform X1 n=1 Tax=Coffea arabica TaxID=13443 RepID=A0A6P6UVK1_COFAR|nr:psbP domain-containing protein 4, chloroplastic-like isoform X1 [Coffea arabica]
MITISYTSCCLAGTNNQQIVASKHFVANSASEKGGSLVKAGAGSTERETVNEESERLIQAVSRRSAMASAMSLATTAFGFPGVGLAVVKQGLLAGRVPGLSEPNEQGWRTYRRPDDKSGGHGVGWSPIIPYAFSVPDGWEEVPVSIADLGGTEIDLRFANSQEGRLFVIVAPVRRFADNISDDAKIEEIGEPDKVIGAFGPEVIGENVEGKVLSAQVAEHSGRKYYQFELEPPHIFITATAAGNRLYLFNVTGSGLQWKRHYKDLKTIAESFRVI